MKINTMPSLRWLKVDDIKIPENRLHSRVSRFFDFEGSIEAEGVLNPIFVFEDENGTYWLADGQNRVEAVKRKGGRIIPAYVSKGSKTDATLHSVKLNILRGKINAGELAELMAYVKSSFGWTVEKLASEFYLSKPHVSKLLRIAENRAVLEKLKNGLISVKEAYNEILGFTVKPISEKKPSFEEKSPERKVSALQETRQESLLSKQALETRQPLMDEDLGVTTNLKQALEEGKRFTPLGPEEEKRERLICAFCRERMLKSEATWIPIHKKEHDLIMEIFEKLEAERKAQNESSQP